jgi:hypothetical protein
MKRYLIFTSPREYELSVVKLRLHSSHDHESLAVHYARYHCWGACYLRVSVWDSGEKKVIYRRGVEGYPDIRYDGV